jgi:hypothetical protein
MWIQVFEANSVLTCVLSDAVVVCFLRVITSTDLKVTGNCVEQQAVVQSYNAGYIRIEAV